MNNLEDKIYKYLKTNKTYYDMPCKHKPMARDIAEIVEKEWQDRIDCEKCNDLQDENEDLKQQLVSIKYLNRGEVEKIYNECNGNYLGFEMNKFVAAICNLAIPENICKMKIYKDGKLKSEKTFIAKEYAIKPITKDKIIEAIKKHSTQCNNPVFKKDGELAGFMDKNYELDDEDIKQIARECAIKSITKEHIIKVLSENWLRDEEGNFGQIADEILNDREVI